VQIVIQDKYDKNSNLSNKNCNGNNILYNISSTKNSNSSLKFKPKLKSEQSLKTEEEIILNQCPISLFTPEAQPNLTSQAQVISTFQPSLPQQQPQQPQSSLTTHQNQEIPATKKRSSRNVVFREDTEYNIEKNYTTMHKKLNSNFTFVSFFDEEQRVESYQTIVNNQKLLIYELRKQNRNLHDKNHRLNYINKLSQDDDLKKKEFTVTFYEDKINQLEKIIKEKDKNFQSYEEKMLRDFAYKENKILDLHNIVGDLEDEKMKLNQIINISKDKDKKKYLEVANQVKTLTKEMQKVVKLLLFY